MARQPWATGPRENLQHGLSLLNDDNDKNRRLALLSIDNAVELTIKTFLGLPNRVNGLSITRKELADISESFPRMLDALENFADDRFNGVDLGEIEWFHRLRNQLYHQGNGLTVDREKVEIYAELARLLYEDLFNDKLDIAPEDHHKRLGAFLASWVKFEQTIGALSKKHINQLSTLGGRVKAPMMIIRELIRIGVFSEEDAREIEKLRQLRNEVVHGIVDYNTVITDAVIDSLKTITEQYKYEIST